MGGWIVIKAPTVKMDDGLVRLKWDDGGVSYWKPAALEQFVQDSAVTLLEWRKATRPVPIRKR